MVARMRVIDPPQQATERRAAAEAENSFPTISSRDLKQIQGRVARHAHWDTTQKTRPACRTGFVVTNPTLQNLLPDRG